MGEARLPPDATMTQAAGVVGLAIGLGRLFGFARDAMIAHVFGATMAADAFFVAFAIPNLVRRLGGEGALSAAMVPIVTASLRKEGPHGLPHLANGLFAAVAVILLLLSGVGMLIAPWLVRAMVPGFWTTPEKLHLTVALTRLMLPFLVFMGLTAVSMGLLNALGHFAVPALAPTFMNIVMIAGILLVSPHLETPIYGLAAAVVVGGALQWLGQMPVLLRRCVPRRWVWDWRHPELARIIWLTLPSLFGLAVADVNSLVGQWLACFLADGSVSYLYYGNRLVEFPLGIFGAALSVAALPVLSSHATQRDLKALTQSVAFAIRLLLFLTLPATCALIVLRVPIVTILFERGEFTRQATEGTAVALLYYGMGLCAYAGLKVVVPAFYALQDTRSPVRIGLYTILLNLLLSLALMGPLAHGGLALATSLAAFVNLGLLGLGLRRHLGQIQGRAMLRSAAKMGLASLATAALTGWLAELMLLPTVSGKAQAALLGGIVLTGIVCYSGLTLLLRSEEAVFLLKLAQRRAVGD